MKIELTLDLAKCFKRKLFIILFVLISLIFSARFCFASCAYSQQKNLQITGLPLWLQPAVSRSILAVWNEIPDLPDIDQEATLKIVASRLFTGYGVEFRVKNDELQVTFTNNEKTIKPEINLIMPELRGITLDWFKEDINGFDKKIFALLNGLPQYALTWADEAFRQECENILKKQLPGWDFNLQVFLSNESTIINISFRPSTPLILAIQPELFSQTVPSMFRTDLEAKLIPELSPLIGIPVKWAELHKTEIEKKSREFLEDKHAVENMKASVNVKFTPAPVANLAAKIDSEKFLFQVWVAAYAGLEGRYPEAGIFFGYKPKLHFLNLKPEIYTELILKLNDFDFIARPGIRFEIFDNFMAGIEFEIPDDVFYVKISYVPMKIKRPYFWWRWAPDYGYNEGGFGYRIDRHISAEFYYESENNDKFGLRGLWFL